MLRAKAVPSDFNPHEAEADEDWWDYKPPEDDGVPWEYKAADWGVLNGRYVAVDYAALAHHSHFHSS